MLGWVKPLKSEDIKNDDFRHVLWTGKHSQLAIMSLKIGEEIGNEVHKVDQFIAIQEGQVRTELRTAEASKPEIHTLEEGGAVIVPAGTWHNIINTGNIEVKLYTVYSPANELPHEIDKTKADAEKREPPNGTKTQKESTTFLSDIL